MQQILEIGDLVGKTIKDIFDNDEGDLYLVFEDDAFCILRDEGCSDNRVPPSIMDYVIDLLPNFGYDSNVQILIRLGVYTQEELNAEIQRKEDQRMQENERQKQHNAIEKEKRDKREYKRLKKKFEAKR